MSPNPPIAARNFQTINKQQPAPGRIMTNATPCGRSPFRPAWKGLITGITAFNSVVSVMVCHGHRAFSAQKYLWLFHYRLRAAVWKFLLTNWMSLNGGNDARYLLTIEGTVQYGAVLDRPFQQLPYSQMLHEAQHCQLLRVAVSLQDKYTLDISDISVSDIRIHHGSSLKVGGPFTSQSIHKTSHGETILRPRLCGRWTTTGTSIKGRSLILTLRSQLRFGIGLEDQL